MAVKPLLNGSEQSGFVHRKAPIIEIGRGIRGVESSRPIIKDGAPIIGLFHAMETRSQLRHRPTIKDKKPTPAQSGSRQVPNSFSPLAFHADAPLYIPGAKTRIPAEPVTCEHICDST